MHKITFSYRLLGRANAEATISDGTNTISLYPSYISDALGDLTYATVGLMQGAPSTRCSFQDEPGEYRWLLEREGDILHIHVLEFDREFSRLADEKGSVIFSTACSLLKFAIQVKTALRELLEELGEEGYREKWVNHDFPISDYQRLEQLIKEQQVKNKAGME